MHSCDKGNLRIICRSFGGESGSFLVQVLDCFHNPICEQITSVNQAAQFSLIAPKEYRIRARAISCAGFSPTGQTIWIKMLPGCTLGRELIFYPMIRPICERFVDVKFRLTDHHYPNLPINEGVLTICPSM